VDGIDQASFLLGDRHFSNRRSRIYTMNQWLSAIRAEGERYTKVLEKFPKVVKVGFAGN
jgi:hypothetical protein